MYVSMIHCIIYAMPRKKWCVFHNPLTHGTRCQPPKETTFRWGESFGDELWGRILKALLYYRGLSVNLPHWRCHFDTTLLTEDRLHISIAMGIKLWIGINRFKQFTRDGIYTTGTNWHAWNSKNWKLSEWLKCTRCQSMTAVQTMCWQFVEYLQMNDHFLFSKICST